jgi:hypothetical protein
MALFTKASGATSRGMALELRLGQMEPGTRASGLITKLTDTAYSTMLMVIFLMATGQTIRLMDMAPITT